MRLRWIPLKAKAGQGQVEGTGYLPMVLVQVCSVDQPVANIQGVRNDPCHQGRLCQARSAQPDPWHPVARGEAQPVICSTLVFVGGWEHLGHAEWEEGNTGEQEKSSFHHPAFDSRAVWRGWTGVSFPATWLLNFFNHDWEALVHHLVSSSSCA